MNRTTRLALGSLLLCAVVPGMAQEPSTGRSISLEEALARTLADNPELVAAGYDVAIWKGRAAQAHLARNPELMLNVEDFAGSGDYGGFDSTETTLSLAWAFERGVRARRVDAAGAGVSLAAIEAELLRVDLVAETARRYLQLLEGQSLLDIGSESVRLAEDTAAAVAHRVQAGRAPQADLHRANASLAMKRLEQRDIQAALTTARLQLALQWGAVRPDFDRAGADPFQLPEPEPYPALRERIEQNPELVRYLSQQRLDEAEVRLAEAQRKQPWIARAGVKRLEATGDQSLVASVAIPLGFRNGNQGNISAARAAADRTRARTAAARLRMETTLSVLYEALQRSRERAMELQRDVVPQLEAAVQETRGAYERGLYSVFDWTIVQAELIDARRRLLDASLESQQHAMEIERLTGVHLSEPESQP